MVESVCAYYISQIMTMLSTPRAPDIYFSLLLTGLCSDSPASSSYPPRSGHSTLLDHPHGLRPVAPIGVRIVPVVPAIPSRDIARAIEKPRSSAA